MPMMLAGVRRFLAGGLVELGMSAWQGVACVFFGNAIVLVPMVLLGHAGVKYGCGPQNGAG